MESEFLIRVKALRKIPCDSPEKMDKFKEMNAFK